MQERKEQLALSSFVHHFCGDRALEMAHHLPEGMSFTEAPPPGAAFASLGAPLSATFEQIHYTWLVKPLKSGSRELTELLLAALPSGDKLSPLLETPKADVELSHPVQAFLLQILAREMHLSGVVPAEVLPVSPCRALLDLSKRQLVRLIGRLGLHDLASSLRRTIDSRPARRIMALLQPTSEKYLKWAMRQRDPLEAEAVPLENWGREKESLAQGCQLQGLRRLGFAIAHEEKSLIWHVSRRLDSGRGELLLKAVNEAPEESVSKRLISQVSGLLQGREG